MVKIINYLKLIKSQNETIRSVFYSFTFVICENIKVNAFYLNIIQVNKEGYLIKLTGQHKNIIADIYILKSTMYCSNTHL